MARLLKPKKADGADDLEILYPDRSVLVGGRMVTVREYAFVEGMRLASTFSEQVQAFKQALNGDAPGDNFSAVIARLISLSTGEDVIAISGCSDADYYSLASAWLQVNGHLFEPQEEEKTAKKAITWGDIHAELIAAGHTLDAIKGYTSRQISLHFQCAQRVNRRQRASNVIDTNAGFAGGKAANALIKSLQD